MTATARIILVVLLVSVRVTAEEATPPTDSDATVTQEAPASSSPASSEAPAESTASTPSETAPAETQAPVAAEPAKEAAPRVLPPPPPAPRRVDERPLPRPDVTVSSPAVTVSQESPPAPPPAPPPGPQFLFGSYGRVIAPSDLAGRTGRNTDLVRYGSRLDESTYAELNLARLHTVGDLKTSVVFTLAMFGPFFHFDADPQDVFAIRQAYAEVEGLGVPGLALWAGSRIARGDDVYLLDVWPLDNLNVIGGGARWAIGEGVELATHVGPYRIRDQYQYQVVDATVGDGFGVEKLELLDRPRTVWAAKATWWPGGRFAAQGFKLIGYTEAHLLPSGVRAVQGGAELALPADSGWVAGLQLGGWHGPSRSFFNAFLRVAGGLGAYNPFESPFRGTTSVTTTERARELLGAVVGNLEFGNDAGLQLGGYLRRFRDAAANDFAGGTTHEGILALRPHWWLGSWFGLSGEVSVQGHVRSSLDALTGKQVGGALLRLAVMPYVTPFGAGSYTRPHIRLIYAATLRDAGAIALAVDEDVRGKAPVEHFLGLGAEWWFDSSYR